MSFGIIRVQKFKASAVGGIQIHDNREKISLTNPDINNENTNKNYHLKICDNFHAKIYDNLQDLKKTQTKAIRKDAVVMCQILITSDIIFFDKLNPEKEKYFFEQALDFVTRRYGENNIISATVHKDEKTPHLHINFTPIKDNRLSAKAIFDKKELTSLQTDFFNNVGKEWNLIRGESKEKKRKHLDVEEYKIQTRKEELKENLELIKNSKVILAHDVEPKIIKSSFLGMKNERENNEEIGKRLTKKYIEPIEYEHNELIKKNSIFLREILNLKAVNENLLKDFVDLMKFKEKFKDLTQIQMQDIFKLSAKYQKENEIKQNILKQELEREKEQRQKEIEQKRLEALETAKDAKRDEQLALDRNKASRLFEGLLKKTVGTRAEHIEQKKKLLEKWDKTENKADFEKAVKEMLQPQKQRQRSMRM